ncbi:MAG: hypothetical protein ACP59X_21065 [Solidesulfovibrio sp. DCME]|uniref:hypothetical protein n=1 Tax=Solidesulfovibrio sp. DCME TaxID=3447380 RepID=UPI003D13142B
MADGAQIPSSVELPPKLLHIIAEAVGTALAEQADAAGQAETPKAPMPPLVAAGQSVGTALAPVAAPVLARAANKFKCPTLWVAIGTIAGLFVQNPLGLQLHPATQVAAAAVAAVYMSATSIVDSAKKGDGNG